MVVARSSSTGRQVDLSICPSSSEWMVDGCSSVVLLLDPAGRGGNRMCM